MVLHDVLGQYATLERDGFRVRMETREARVYGERVLDLLVAARSELEDRYRIELDDVQYSAWTAASIPKKPQPAPGQQVRRKP